MPPKSAQASETRPHGGWRCPGLACCPEPPGGALVHFKSTEKQHAQSWAHSCAGLPGLRPALAPTAPPGLISRLTPWRRDGSPRCASSRLRFGKQLGIPPPPSSLPHHLSDHMAERVVPGKGCFVALLRTLEHQSKDAQTLVTHPQVACGWRARPPSTGQERAALSQDTGARPPPCRLLGAKACLSPTLSSHLGGISPSPSLSWD